MADIECVFESMTSRGSIYISNLQAAQSIQLLHSLNIKAILSVARSGFLQHSKEDVPHYLYIPAEDHEDYQLHTFFDQTYHFIEKARRETNVLVHCKVGVSRSVTIVIAYLIKKYKYSLGQVITMVLRKRNKINPNKGFLQQLKIYAQAEGIKCDLSSNYIENLREQSHSRRKHCYSAQKEKGSYKKQLDPLTSPNLGRDHKQQLQQPAKNYEVTCKEDLLAKPLVQMRKGRSFDQSVEKVKDIENGERESKDQKEVNDKLMKKTVSLKEEPKNKRRLSIEQKISKIRDKILKKQHLSVEKSPRLKSYQDQRKQEVKPATDNSLLRSNRFQKIEQRFSNSIKSNKTNTLLNIPSFLLKNEISQKGDIFAVELDIDSANLYSNNKRIHRRVNSKLAPQVYQ